MVEAAADRIWRVAIEPDGHRPATLVAGQFAWLNLGHSPFSLTEHPFSFVSAPVSLPRLEGLWQVYRLSDGESAAAPLRSATGASRLLLQPDWR